jgi:hypothetical protein
MECKTTTIDLEAFHAPRTITKQKIIRHNTPPLKKEGGGIYKFKY